MAFKITALVAVCAVASSMVLSSAAPAAASASGVAGWYGGSAFSADSTNQAVASYFPSGSFGVLGGFPGLPFRSSIPFSASDSASVSAAQGNASSSVSLSVTRANGNLALHGLALAQTHGCGRFCPTAGAGFDLYASDTFHILGTTGVPQTFDYILTLDGSTSFQGAFGLSENEVWDGVGSVGFIPSCVGGFSQGNPCGPISGIVLAADSPSRQTTSGTITFVGGSSVVLSLGMVTRIGASGLNDTNFFDASNTGFFTLTPVTPGAGFTTASGLTYANSPDASVSEPATWAMMVVGLGGLGAAMRFRQRTVAGRVA